MELGRVLLGEVAAASLLGDRLDDDRAFHLLGALEDVYQPLHVVSVERAEEGEAQFLEDHAAAAGQHELLGAAHAALGDLPGDAASWHVIEGEAGDAAQPPVVAVGADAVEIGVQRADVVGDALIVVVEDDDELFVQRASVVDGFERHAAGERAVADDRDDVEGLALEVARGGEAQRGGDRGAGVARAEDVVLALLAAQVAREAVELLDRAELVAPAGDELVRIRLVADIPDQQILGRVEGDMQREGQLDGAEVGGEVPTAQRHRLDDLLADLLRELIQLGRRESTQLRRLVNAIQYSSHAISSPHDRSMICPPAPRSARPRRGLALDASRPSKFVAVALPCATPPRTAPHRLASACGDSDAHLSRSHPPMLRSIRSRDHSWSIGPTAVMLSPFGCADGNGEPMSAPRL